ncbi:peptide chain release factor 1, partial [Sulfolobus sp. A20-N-G8]
EYFDYRIKKMIIQPLIDVSDQGEVGLREMVMRAQDLLKNQQYVEVQKLLEELKYHLAKDDGLIIYGIDAIKKAVEMGAVDSLIIYEDSGDEVEKLSQEAENYGVKIYVVNDEIPEAEWVRKTFNGIVGKLRYRIY